MANMAYVSNRKPMLTSLLCLIPAITWNPELPAPGPRGQLALADGSILIPGRKDGPGARLVCFVSRDEGKSWAESGVIATDPERRTDIGDGNIVQGSNGELLAVFRHNHHGEKPDYAVEVSVSRDGGKTWEPHSTVATSRPEQKTPSRGLWSPLLFVTEKGDVQCYYDDEDTPFRKGFRGHQWLTMKTYSARKKQWERPITVARAHDPKLLSRDGMAAVAELKKGQLLCAFESVQTAAPHAGVIRKVISEDGGRTWSWSKREREVLYEPRDTRYHAFCPSLAKLPDGGLIALFATNEDRADPGVSGTPARELSLDIKSVTSADGGRTWDRTAAMIYGGTHRNYLPGIVRIGDRFFASFLDFDRGSLSKIGQVN